MNFPKDFTKQKDHIWKPLEGRTFHYKKSAMDFFCPLCRTQRNFSISFRLSTLNYVQMVIITILFTAATYSWWELRGVFVFFLLWPTFELVRRVLFKREIPCPYCGFDASWYKKDVKVARKLVSDFWQEHPAYSQAKPDQNVPETSSQIEL